MSQAAGTWNDGHVHPRLAQGVRLHWDRHDERTIVLHPEGVLRPSETAAAILTLCDGRRSVREIAAVLAARYGGEVEGLLPEIIDFLEQMRTRLIVTAARGSLGELFVGGCPGAPPPHPDPLPVGARATACSPRAAVSLGEGADGPLLPLGEKVPEGRMRGVPRGSAAREGTVVPRPEGLVAELTYRCPLHCPYCSNPTLYPPGDRELSTEEWRRVFAEAGSMGVLHALLSGGEPLVRPDLAELVAAARARGLYTNLITSGVGLSHDRTRRLQDAGLDSVQISLQADEEGLADVIAGVPAHAAKLRAAQVVRALGLPLTINVVIHRQNIDRVGQVIALAEGLGAHRLELANVQFYGWAARNQAALLPDRAQVERAEILAAEGGARLRGRMTILYVRPDYFDDRPKPCLGGWGRRYLTVNPLGDVLPCPTAGAIAELHFENVRDRSLKRIWCDSEAFNRFRGTAWLPDPCRGCPLREVDFGGCRCQAALLTGSAANTDPVCGLSPHHAALPRATPPAAGPPPEVIYRTNPGHG